MAGKSERMASDSTDGLHYSRDVTEEIRDKDFIFTNPHNQPVGGRWVRGERVFAMPQGVIHIDPIKQKWAKEFVLIYGMDGPDGNPERVPDQWGIYDTKPGDADYSPIWRYHAVTVPRDYEPNTIRSEDDILSSGYPVRHLQQLTGSIRTA